MKSMKIIDRLFKANGIKLSINAREALECGGLTPLLMSKLNAIGFEKPMKLS
jgi:hypothetical protein